MFQVELVWNREFHFILYGGSYLDIKSAIKFAKEMEMSGDGARVKKTRVVNSDGAVVWAYGKMVK